MFESKTVTGHLARGAIGFAALGWAATSGHAWALIVGLPVSLIALRGCPMCWTLGLAQTVVARLRGRPTDGLCRDGSCALRGPGRATSTPGPGASGTAMAHQAPLPR